MPSLLLPFFIILLSVFALLRNRSSNSFQEKQDAFWEKERQANLSRKKDISDLDYIQIPMDTFPIGQFTDDTLARLEATLKALSSQKILNLSGISNTDLKLAYGAANLPVLSECDANFTVLARTISAYGSRLAELDHCKEAILVLEFGVACRTDVSTNYILLHKLYEECGQTAQADELAETVRNSDMLLKDSILAKIL